MRTSLTVALVAAILGVAPAVAIEPPAAGDISGPWVGEGFVQRDEGSKPMKVRCAIAGAQQGENIGFEGECRAMLVVKREIGAQLTRSGETYTGTYKGSNIGVAALAGTQTAPDTLSLTMTFPGEVNGDTTARMTITRPADGTFTITTEDEMMSGETVTTSQITFARE